VRQLAAATKHTRDSSPAESPPRMGATPRSDSEVVCPRADCAPTFPRRSTFVSAGWHRKQRSGYRCLAKRDFNHAGIVVHAGARSDFSGVHNGVRASSRVTCESVRRAAHHSAIAPWCGILTTGRLCWERQRLFGCLQCTQYCGSLLPHSKRTALFRLSPRHCPRRNSRGISMSTRPPRSMSSMRSWRSRTPASRGLL